VEKLGDFTILRKLGEGGMGSVWLAVGSDKQRVAVKVLPPQLAKQRQFLTRFFREAESSIKLQHKNIVKGVAVGEEGGRYYFAMEFVPGRSVRQMIEKSGALPVEQATDIILQAAEGVAHAHQNSIIHRDIKPDNIMVTRNGVAKLADLGLARQTDADVTALTRTGTSMGTPYYMAPEQTTDAKRADARSDIYALGASWYHMVTGQLPFIGESALEIFQKHLKEPVKSPASVRPGLPRGVSITIERMMAKDPENRIQTAEELCRIIREQCLGERDVVKELGLEERGAKESMWDMRVPAGGGLETRRMSLSGLRQRVRSGRVTRDTPTRRAGSRAGWQPAGSFKELAREFPKDYAVHVDPTKGAKQDTPRGQLRDLVTHFDQASRAYGRKKTFKKMIPYLIEFVIALVIIAVVICFWSQIWGFVSGLFGKSAEAG
ncbi:MAG: protein kinase, partial [Candidatus Brocadiae bacterium]|nr:protein kinase [Candidatus Brocadiia bacterium]